MKRYFPGLKKILSARDIVVKIICVLLAIILWAYINSTNKGEMKFKIPITFLNLQDTLIMSRITNRYVTVTISGKKDNLKNINIKSIQATVNLEQPEIGVYRNYPIEVIRDEIPENVDLNLSIKDVNLIIERRAYKKVKVKANIVDKVIDNYVLGKITIIPDSITINGPESLVNKIDFMQTEKISIANVKDKLIKDVPIVNRDAANINMDISKVKVIIPVIESADLFLFNKNIILRNKIDGFNYSLNPEEILVYLQSDTPDRAPSADDVDVFIDVGIIDPEELFRIGNDNSIEKSYPIVAINKKEDVKIVSIFPDIVTVKISEK